LAFGLFGVLLAAWIEVRVNDDCGVKFGGNWQLFAQQNNPGLPFDGVSNIM
jgi:hypothetical protein